MGFASACTWRIERRIATSPCAVVLGLEGHHHAIGRDERGPRAKLDVRRAINHHQVEAFANVGQGVAKCVLEQACCRRPGHVQILKGLGAGEDRHTRDLRRPDQLGGRGPASIVEDGGECLDKWKVSRDVRTQETLRQRGLRVGIDQQDAPAELGQGTREMMAGGRLPHPAFFVQKRDRVGHL